MASMFFLCLALVSFFLSSQSGCHEVNLAPSILTDKEALISFKSLVTTDPSNTLTSWDNNSSPCNWTGVYCNKSRQRVMSLDLSGLYLKGSISPHIGNLSFLRSLQLQENQLTGAIPDEIGKLFHLQVLNMSFNQFSSAIPSNITKCSNLRILDLMENEIFGSIPEELSHLSNLQILNLASNVLSGPIPPSITNLSSLLTLNLFTNSLRGMIPNYLGRLRNLEYLDLSINNLTGEVPPSLYNISSLVHLSLASNHLWGQIPYDVGDRLPRLIDFNFCINKFTGSFPASLYNLTNIRNMRMAHNLLTGPVPPAHGNLPELFLFNIGFNHIKNTGDEGLNFINAFRNSTRLEFLNIESNILEGVIPESVGNLSSSLKRLYMGGNRIYGRIPASIRHLKGLASLNISYTYISGEIPPEIGELTNLQELHLAANNISGRIPNSLGNLRKLNEINLSANKLVGSLPTTFVNFQKLLSMDLSSNKLNGSIPKEIFSLLGLSTFLNLSNNQLSGPLPLELGRLESVVTIDLSHNNLSGSIPSSIGSCKSLEQLFMANNMFSGSIPDTLGDVRGLEILDLSLNQLSGLIPRKLGKLLALRLLNLSFNDLEGIVPSEGIFGNLSSVHIEGNSKLCLDTACEYSQSHEREFKAIHVITISIAAVAVCSGIGVLLCLRRRKAQTKPTECSTKVQHQMISYEELFNATESFAEENLIGKGSFGSVYKGHLRNGNVVAIKVFDIEKKKSSKSFLAECEALKNVRHRNLVKLITSCSSIDFRGIEFLALVYEYMSSGSLEDWITGRRRHPDGEPLNILERLNVVIDIAYAMDYLHHDCEIPVVHCDLKPSNVLLHQDMTAKVGDFGLARLLTERADNQPKLTCTGVLRGSIGYIPPEYGLGLKPSTSGDVYSYGVMLLELFTGKRPTDESFTGGLNMIKWVQAGFPAQIEQAVDPELLLPIGDFHQEAQSVSLERQKECLTTVIGVGLSCTIDSSDGRISMRDALHKLKAARDILLKPAHKLEPTRSLGINRD